MNMKTATLVALIGVTLSYVIGLVTHLTHGIRIIYLVQSALFSIPMILFLFTLHGKQQ